MDVPANVLDGLDNKLQCVMDNKSDLRNLRLCLPLMTLTSLPLRSSEIRHEPLCPPRSQMR